MHRLATTVIAAATATAAGHGATASSATAAVATASSVIGMTRRPRIIRRFARAATRQTTGAPWATRTRQRGWRVRASTAMHRRRAIMKGPAAATATRQIAGTGRQWTTASWTSAVVAIRRPWITGPVNARPAITATTGWQSPSTIRATPSVNPAMKRQAATGQGAAPTATTRRAGWRSPSTTRATPIASHAMRGLRGMPVVSAHAATQRRAGA